MCGRKWRHICRCVWRGCVWLMALAVLYVQVALVVLYVQMALAVLYVQMALAVLYVQVAPPVYYVQMDLAVNLVYRSNKSVHQ